MKLFKFIIPKLEFYVVILLCCIYHFSCVKEIQETKVTNLTSRTGSYPFTNFLQNYASLQNGILNFPDWQTFQNYSGFMRNFENDTTNFNLAINYLENNNYEKSSNPVLEVIELMNQFYSSRKKYELLSVQSKISSEYPDDYIDHFMHDPYYETTLNEYNEVKIGSLYFRLLDQDKTVIVGNSDLTKFIETRSQTNFISYQNENNVFFLDLEKADINLVFNGTEENSRASFRPLVMPDFTYEYQADSTYKFKNTSFFDVGNSLAPIYKWTFSNGIEYTGFEPPDQIINSSEESPASCHLEIMNYTSPYNNITEELVPQVCFHNVKICIDGANVTIDIRNESWYPPGCPVLWDFGDGTTGSGAYVTHTYSFFPLSNLTKIFKIKGRLKCLGECDFFAKFSISFGCNKKGSSTKTYEQFVAPITYRLISMNWASENIFNGTAGASTESFIKPNLSSPLEQHYTNLGVSIQGMVWLNVNGCCVLQPIGYSYLGSLNNKITLINQFTQSTRIRYLPNEFWSTHSLQMIGGQIFNTGNHYLR